MSNAPAHAKEHDELMQLVAKATERSRLIAGTIVVTVGLDSRPGMWSTTPCPIQGAYRRY